MAAILSREGVCVCVCVWGGGGGGGGEELIARNKLLSYIGTTNIYFPTLSSWS